MTTIQRFTPDYKMHAVRFEAFAREAEHGEYVRFDAHQQEVIALKAERDAQQKRADALEVRLRNALISEQEAIQRAHAANQTIDALAVENQALSAALSLISGSYGLSPHIQSMCAVDTPTTDSALAAVQARAKAEAFAEIIEFIDRRSGLAEMKTQWDLSSAIVAHISELREAK
ncbi:hypothetical protein [Serratia sarumanii]|uniref:Uncharacterized protein n=1 Tax=Serratia sarumanii TaxID=3020826 RepID=A0ABW8QKF9_9GAMM